jgi:hypothetical protein
MTTTPVQENGYTQTNPAHAVPIVILGTDAMLAALPATPVQLAHACLRAGFANVIPASWGDELIAVAILRRLAPHGGPAIQCSCPKVAHRLLSVGGDLRPVMVPVVSPPVAAARYVHSVSQPTRLRITYVGACPGAVDDSIDIRMSPEALLSMLAEREIVPVEEPRVFEGVIPPDRRRFRSQPGGLPTAEQLWSESGGRTLVEIDRDDIPAEIAQHILSGRPVLIDVSARLGCVCAGAVSGTEPREARAHVVAHEPPRATSPVVGEVEPIDLDLAVPAAPRAPADIVAAVETPTPTTRTSDPNVTAPTPPHASASTPPAQHSPTPIPSQGSLPPRISPTPGMSTVADPRSGRPHSSAIPPRPVLGSVPVARATDGKALPRAYIARRRSSPRGVDAVPPRVETPPQGTIEPETTPPERPAGEQAEASIQSSEIETTFVESTFVESTSTASTESLPDTPAPPEAFAEPEAYSLMDPSLDVSAPSATIHETESPTPARSRRSMWLIVLLIVAVIVGVGVGIAIARSAGR